MADEELTTVRGEPHEHRAVSPPGEVGRNIGRYVTLGIAGRGGSGIVYKAYDPELDRKVALKLIGGPAAADLGRARGEVLHEARALARLRDTNVLAVHDVGEHEGRVFVVMEFVDGSDLGAWVAKERPDVPAVLRAMTQAARGLAIAHDEGIVHRDFKPANVLVDRRGRVLVADFGLAQLVARRGSAAADEASKARPAGTPAYLAPELYAGRDAGVRSDIYAFCVTLWEALYAERPWTGGTETALLSAKQDGPPNPPLRPAVPARVRSLLRAGLSVDPDARPESMHVVRAALQPSRSRLPWLLVPGSVTIAGIGAWAFVHEPPCDGGVSQVQAVWSPQRRSVLEQRAAPPQAWPFFASRVDRFVQTWTHEHRDACEATHVRHEQSEERLDRRMACLHRELRQLDTLLSELDVSQADELAKATSGVGSRGWRIECAVDSQGGAAHPPAEAEAIVVALDRVQVLETLGRYDDAAALAAEATQDAAAGGFDALAAVGEYRVGRLLGMRDDPRGAHDRLVELHLRAEGEGWTDLAIRAGLEVVYLRGAVLDDPEGALAWAPHVGATIRRAGDPVDHRAALLDFTGVALQYAHRYDEALAELQRAAELREANDADPVDRSTTLGNLGILLEEMGRYEEAIEYQQTALDLLVGALGDGHPRVAIVIDNLGTARLRNAEVAEAIELFERALAIRERTLAPEHRALATSRMHLGHARLQAGDPEAAIEHFVAARTIYARSLDADSRSVLRCHEALAHAHAALEHWPDALAEARFALEGLERSLPPEHPELVALREIVERARTHGAGP